MENFLPYLWHREVVYLNVLDYFIQQSVSHWLKVSKSVILRLKRALNEKKKKHKKHAWSLKSFPHICGFFLKDYAVWPFVCTQRDFQVIKTVIFGKILPGNSAFLFVHTGKLYFLACPFYLTSSLCVKFVCVTTADKLHTCTHSLC